jgi:hypothetical protein
MVLAMAFTASAQDTIAPGDTVEGTLEESTAEYTFSAAAGDVYLIELNSPDFDAEITVLNASGSEVGSDDDSGPENNSRLAFVASEDGDYTIQAAAWLGDATGAYTLSLTAISPTMLAYGDSVTDPSDGANPTYYLFEGASGDVINLWATNTDDADIELDLFFNNEEIDHDSDDGRGVQPYLRRLILPGDGLYLVSLYPWFDREITGDSTINLEQTDLLLASEEPGTAFLGDINDVEVWRFEAAGGSSYRLIVTAEDQDSFFTVSLRIGGFSEGSISASGTSRISYDFRSDTTDMIDIELDYSSFSGGKNFSVAVEPLG